MWVLLIYRMPGCVWVLSTNSQTHERTCTDLKVDVDAHTYDKSARSCKNLLGSVIL
ncbi:hypothetical protein ACB094_11G165100 [Castanea mollissima]